MTFETAHKHNHPRTSGTEETDTAKKSFSIYKTDDDKRLVFGWASIAVTIDGEVLEDRQHDIIDPADLEEAVYEYVLNFRDTGEEHISSMRKKGKLVESCVFTEEKQKAMGIPVGILPVGWWIGFKIEDDDAWARVKNGTYKMFSIEGKAKREPVQKFNPNHDERGRFAPKNGGSAGGGSAEPKMDAATAISQYQNYGYGAVNGGLRSGNVEGTARDITDALDHAIKNAEPTKWDQTVHRADGTATTAEIWERTGLSAKLPRGGDFMDVWYDSDARNAITEAMVGQTFTDKAFMSTSKDWASAEAFATGNRYTPHGVDSIVHINVPKGTRVLDLGDDGFISGSGEHEVILARGSSYKITAVTMNHAIGGLDIYADLVTDTAKSATMAKTFRSILKFNPFHDARGRFSDANGYASFTTQTRDPKKQHWADMAVERQKQRAAAAGAGAGAADAADTTDTTPTPQPRVKNYDRLGYADYDDADFHQLYNGRQYYQQQQFDATQKAAANSYLDATPEPYSLYSHSQNLNYQMATGQTLTGKYKQTHDGLMSAMHNIGYNVELTRYDHPDMVNSLLSSIGAGSNYEYMSQASLRSALVGRTVNEDKFLSTSYNGFSNAPQSTKQVFNSRAVKINYHARADVQAVMPGIGPGGDFGEIILAPTNGTANRGGTITDVRLTGQLVRRKGTQTYDQPRIEIDIEI